MDLHLKSPLPLSTSRSSSTFPLTHGSQPNDPPPTEEPVAGRAGRSSRRPQFQHATDGPSSPNPAPNDSSSQDRPSTRPLIEPLGFEGNKSHHHRHKHSKSRELRLPRPMSHLASSASARGLLPTWSGGRDKDREGDDGLLRPVTRETTRTRWGSDSASGLGTDSRKGSLLDTPEQHERLGPIRRQEIQSMEDLEKVKKRRKQGEEYESNLGDSIALSSTLTAIKVPTLSALFNWDFGDGRDAKTRLHLLQPTREDHRVELDHRLVPGALRIRIDPTQRLRARDSQFGSGYPQTDQ